MSARRLDLIEWKHDELAADLAQYLRSPERMVWTDMQLGPSGSPRPDVYTLEKSYSRPMPTAYECKISRSDLRSDTTSGKWQKYLTYAGAVIFAVPDGLCTPADIPASCGLIVRKAQVWRMVRKATRTPASLGMDACMKLLIDGVNRTVGQREPSPRRAELWRESESVRKKFGQAVAIAAMDLARARSLLADEQAVQSDMRARVDRDVELYKARVMDQAKREVAEFEQAKRDLCDWLGIDHNPAAFTVRQRIAEMKRLCDADQRVERAEAKLEQARRSIQSALHAVSPPQEGLAA